MKGSPSVFEEEERLSSLGEVSLNISEVFEYK